MWRGIVNQGFVKRSPLGKEYTGEKQQRMKKIVAARPCVEEGETVRGGARIRDWGRDYWEDAAVPGVM